MTESSKKFVVAALCALFLSVVVLLYSTHKLQEWGNAPAPPTRELSSHPLYSKYNFDNSAKVINIGTQPLYVPTGLITETIKRDLILKKELSSLGYTLQMFPLLKGDDVNFFLERGDLDAGVGGDMPALSLAARHKITIPVRIQRGPVSIVLKKHILIEKLRGKKIGYAFGSNAHYALLEILAGADITEKDVQLIAMDVDTMLKALDKGDIYAFAAWEPTPEIGKRKYHFVKGYQSISAGFMYFNREFFDNHPKAGRQIIAAQIRAARWLTDSRENLLKAGAWALAETEILLGRKVDLTAAQNADLAEKDFLGHKFSASIAIPAEDLNGKGELRKEYEFLKKLGKISPASSWPQVHASFDLEIVKEITVNSQKFLLDKFAYGD